MALLIVAMGSVWHADADANANANTRAGKKVFKKNCAACHSIKKNKNKIGPSLHGLVGRKAAAVSSYKKYSAAIKGADLVLTAENLTSYLEDPKRFLPGIRMNFPGIKDADALQNLIGYLATKK